MSIYDKQCEVSALIGETITAIEGCEVGSESIRFTLKSGAALHMEHLSDCCESVEVVDVNGDLNDLLNSPVLIAEESTNEGGPIPCEYAESWTWTFYRLATEKGWVILRWLGQSNGYYGETVYVWKEGA